MNQELVGKLRAKAAAVRYGNPSRATRIIAVAGTAGKTTTACLIAELLKQSNRSVMLLTNRGIDVNGTYSDATYDDHADALQQFLARAKRESIDFVVLEVTDALIKSCVMPTIDIDTAVLIDASTGSSLLLEQPLHYAVLPSDLSPQNLEVAQHQTITFGEGIEAEAKLNTIKLYRKGTEVNLTIDHQTTFDLATFLVGRANAFNVLAATAAAYVLSINLESLRDGVARLELVTGNYQYIDSGQLYQIVADGANTDRSVELVTASAKELAKRRLIVALEADGLSHKTLEQLQKRCDRLLLVGGETLSMTGVDAVRHFDEAVRLALRGAKQDDTVMLIGPEFTRRLDNGDIYAEQLVRENHQPVNQSAVTS